MGSGSIVFPYAAAIWNSQAEVLFACSAAILPIGKIVFWRAVMWRDVRLGVLRYGLYSPPSELVDFDDVEDIRVSSHTHENPLGTRCNELKVLASILFRSKYGREVVRTTDKTVRANQRH